jgi:hypothetical protein
VARSALVRTPHRWEGERLRRTLMDLWNGRPRRGALEPEPPEAARPKLGEVLAGAPRLVGPRRAERRSREEVLHTPEEMLHSPQAERRSQAARPARDWEAPRRARPEPGPDRPSLRKDSTLQACLPDSAEARARKAAVGCPKERAPAPVGARVGHTAAEASPIAGQLGVVVPAAVRNAPAAEAPPTAEEVVPAEEPRGPARSGREDLAGSVQAPPRQVQRPPGARRTTSRTCWWADSWRHTACRRS